VLEVPIYGVAPARIDGMVAGRADAVARADNGDLGVFDWKSDVAPSDTTRLAYREQLGWYLHVLGAKHGAVVYMTSGHVDRIVAP
jgi:CRISPR-associated exonuclease Cas4